MASDEILTWIIRGSLGLGGYLVGRTWWSMDRRLTALEARDIARGERIAALEAHYAMILSRLERIESKLDAIRP